MDRITHTQKVDTLSERALLAKHPKVAKAINYLLAPKHWPSFTRFLEDGRVCLTKNAAERSLRGIALGRKSWLFVGSERGGDLHPDRYGQGQRHRPPGVLLRRHRTHLRYTHLTPPRTAPVELETGGQNGKRRQGRIAAVFTACL